MADQKITALTSLAQADITPGTDVLPIVDVGSPSVTKKATPKAVVGASVNDLAQTWNNVATTFTAIKMNATDTASAAGSALMDLQVAGVSQFKVSKAGAVTAVGVAIPTISSTDTLSNKTLSSPTLSGTVSGSVTVANAWTFSGAFATTFNRPSDPEFALALSDAGTVRGYIGCNSTISLRISNNAFTEQLAINRTTHAAAFLGALTALSGTAIPAGGTAGSGLMVSSTANFGVFFGSGAPTLSAAKGSLYMRSDGSTTNDRMYVNTDGATTWTAVTTAA